MTLHSLNPLSPFGPDEGRREIFEQWIFTTFIRKQKGKETQQLEQTPFYVIACDFFFFFLIKQLRCH